MKIVTPLNNFPIYRKANITTEYSDTAPAELEASIAEPIQNRPVTIKAKHSELPWSNNRVNIEVVEVDEIKLTVKINGENYEIRTPYSESFNNVTLNVGDKAVFRLVQHGLNGYKIRLEFEAYMESSILKLEPYDLSAIAVNHEEDVQEVKHYTVENKTWHKWDDNLDAALIRSAEKGITVDEMLQSSLKSGMPFTKRSIQSRLNRKGYSIKKGIPAKRAS